MGEVVVLGNFEYRRKIAARTGLDSGNAEILLFTGVRYERFDVSQDDDPIRSKPRAVRCDRNKLLPH